MSNDHYVSKWWDNLRSYMPSKSMSGESDLLDDSKMLGWTPDSCINIPALPVLHRVWGRKLEKGTGEAGENCSLYIMQQIPNNVVSLALVIVQCSFYKHASLLPDSLHTLLFVLTIIVRGKITVNSSVFSLGMFQHAKLHAWLIRQMIFCLSISAIWRQN